MTYAGKTIDAVKDVPLGKTFVALVEETYSTNYGYRDDDNRNVKYLSPIVFKDEAEMLQWVREQYVSSYKKTFKIVLMEACDIEIFVNISVKK